MTVASRRRRLMPPREDASELVPRRDGVTWRVAGDARLFAGAGYALLLQVMHPDVGAGVTQHSNFKQDPWGRLVRTLDYTSAMVYGGPDLAWEIGGRMRESHRSIKGVRPDGRRYHALDPRPYAWVHATLAESIIRGHDHFCSSPLSAAELAEFWNEWRRLGRLIGIREEELPATWPQLLAYFDEMVERELEGTEAARDVLGSLRDPAAPPLPLMRDGVWRVLRWPSAKAGSLATLGMLPPVLRDRLDVEWTASTERRFRALGRLLRTSGPLMPPPARRFGSSYLRWRGIGETTVRSHDRVGVRR